MLTAITRGVSPRMDNCELTYLSRERIEVEKARRQQKAYEQFLVDNGVRVLPLPAEPELPDAVFVEDTAVVVDEVAVIPTMGAASRQPEVESTARTLKSFRPLEFINGGGTLEGGDVMRIGRTLYVGVSSRTNRDGIAQLQNILRPFDYQVKPVGVTGCLHLKTGCTYLGKETVLANSAWVDTAALDGFDVIEVPAGESWAGNALTVNGVALLPASCPQTVQMLRRRGFDVRTIDVSEFGKAEGSLTCLSIIFNN